MKSITKRQKARAFIAKHRDAPLRSICAAVGIDEREAQRIRAAMKCDKPAGSSAKTDSKPRSEVSFEDKGPSGIASSLSTRITTLEQLLIASKVDLSIWEVERHIVNKWEVAMKEEAPKTKRVHAIVEPLIQIKAWLRRKTPQEIGMRAALAEQIAEARRTPAKIRPISYVPTRGECLAELDIFDLHYGKLCWAAESGEDMDVKIAEKNFKEAVARLRDAAVPYGISQFLFPVGNDYLNVDNEARTTTAGTPQDEDGRWQRTFTNGRRLLVWAVNYLREVAPVVVLVIRGNHDWQRTFYLGDSLECWFHADKAVHIDNTPPGRKYFAWGNVLLGFTHGDKEALKDLPLTMAVERPDLWAEAKYREFHLGHIHHKRTHDFQPVAEQKGIVVRHLSSLTAADAWHAQKGYRAQRSAQCFIWHKEHGCQAELAFNL